MTVPNPATANPLIEWLPNLMTGIGVIDSQHKGIAAILDEIREGINEGQGQKAESQGFAKLIESTIEHFRTEESLMEEHDYHGKDHHARIHVMLIGMLEYYLEKYHKDQNASNADLLSFLRDWLIEHILIDDKPFGDFLLAKGVA